MRSYNYMKWGLDDENKVSANTAGLNLQTHKLISFNFRLRKLNDSDCLLHVPYKRPKTKFGPVFIQLFKLRKQIVYLMVFHHCYDGICK